MTPLTRQELQRLDEIAGMPVKVVPAAVARASLQRRLAEAPAFADFRATKRGLFARPRAAGGFEIIAPGALKGAAFALQWGLSLPWVPHDWHDRVSWHRTLESARLDLFEWPQKRDGTSLLATGLHGEPALDETLGFVWTRLHDDIAAWFARASSNEGALAIAAENTIESSVHWPRRAIVHALLCAHLGRDEEATRQVEDFIARWHADDRDSALGLRKALASVIARREK